MCFFKMYSLERGFFIGLIIYKYIMCFKCFFGVYCNGFNNILVKVNFWGYKIINGSNFFFLKFLFCFWEYCCYKDFNLYYDNGYNKCYGYRFGIFCG